MNKKAFTLVELLAVIIILGVLAMLIGPKIVNTLDEAEKNTYMTSAEGIVKAATYKYSNNDVVGDTNKEIIIDYKEGINTDYLDFNGDKPESGQVKITEKGKVALALKFKDYCYIKDYETDKITLEQYDETTCVIKNKFKIIAQAEEGKIQTGDELAIETEHFYVVSSDNDNTVLLAKYNLLVGNTEISTSGTGEVSGAIVLNDILPTDEGYGLQNENTKDYIYKIYIGSTNTEKKLIGIQSFSKKNYWNDKVGEGLTYPGDYSKPNYPYVYDSNSNLYNYVEEYKSELEKLNVNINKARLLTYQEAINLGCTSSYEIMCPIDTEKNSFITETNFWLGSAYDDDNIWAIRTSGGIQSYDKYSRLGTRPVLEIKTSDIEK